MLKIYEYLGPSPSDEDCVQVGSENYAKRARAECKKYVELLKQIFPLYHRYECEFRIVPQAHDFGTYYEVILYCNPENRKSVQYCEFINEYCPRTWDDDRVRELR